MSKIKFQQLVKYWYYYRISTGTVNHDVDTSWSKYISEQYFSTRKILQIIILGFIFYY